MPFGLILSLWTVQSKIPRYIDAQPELFSGLLESPLNDI